MIETVVYLVFGSAATAALIAAILLAASPVAFAVGRRTYGRFAARLTLFAFVVFVCGVPGNLLFIAVANGRYYVPGDPLIEWLPFVPSGDWIIDPAMGGRYVGDATVWSLRTLWASIAVPTWLVAAFIYRVIEPSVLDRTLWRYISVFQSNAPHR